MEPISQALVGASLSASFSKKSDQRWAMLIGAVAGMLADLDFLIFSSSDPLLQLEFHRQFSHSLIFVPIGAGICFLIFWGFLNKKLSVKRIYLYSFLGYLTHGLLDACTSWGTQLFWPFSDARVSFQIISVFDPFLTVGLLVLLGFTFIRHKPLSSKLSVVFLALYLSFGFYQREKAAWVVSELALSRGDHNFREVLAKPTVGNLILWRTVYRVGSEFQVDAVRLSPFGKPQVYLGESISEFDAGGILPADSIQLKDIERYKRHTKSWLASAPHDPFIAQDIRYSYLPQSTVPMYGIRLKPTEPQSHVSLISEQKFTEADRLRFLIMLRGEILPDITKD